MSALDASLAALTKAHNLSSCSISLLSGNDRHDAFYSVSLQWLGDFGLLDGVVEHGETSSKALQIALAAMTKRRTVAFAGELA